MRSIWQIEKESRTSRTLFPSISHPKTYPKISRCSLPAWFAREHVFLNMIWMWVQHNSARLAPKKTYLHVQCLNPLYSSVAPIVGYTESQVQIVVLTCIDCIDRLVNAANCCWMPRVFTKNRWPSRRRSTKWWWKAWPLGNGFSFAPVRCSLCFAFVLYHILIHSWPDTTIGDCSLSNPFLTK